MLTLTLAGSSGGVDVVTFIKGWPNDIEWEWRATKNIIEVIITNTHKTAALVTAAKKYLKNWVTIFLIEKSLTYSFVFQHNCSTNHNDDQKLQCIYYMLDSVSFVVGHLLCKYCNNSFWNKISKTVIFYENCKYKIVNIRTQKRT